MTLNTGHPDLQAGDDSQSGSRGLIAKSIKNCERLVGAALKLAQAHRAPVELNFPAGIPAEAAANVNALAGIPGKRPSVTHSTLFCYAAALATQPGAHPPTHTPSPHFTGTHPNPQ